MKLEPLLNRLSIVDTRARLIPFKLNWAQQEYLAEVERQYTERRLVRVIVLKARQLGCSTLTEAIMFLWCFVFPRVQGLVMAHEASSAQHLLGMTRTYWDTYPFKSLYSTQYKSRNELSWVETVSSLKVATAKTVDTGRSKTLQMLHLSECAFYEHAEETMGGLEQSFHFEPGTFGVLESTANGVGGFFYDQWNAAVNNEIEYKPLFFPWWKHPQYTYSYVMRASQSSLPALGHCDEEERVLQKLGVNADHLLWRRWALRNLCQNNESILHSEYPSTPDEAFVATGQNVFPLQHIRICYEPIEHPIVGKLIREGSKVVFVPDIAGPLKIYAYPSKDTEYGKYMVAGDPARSAKDTSDYACGQVINRRTYEQVAVWRGKIDGATFGEELAKIGMYYNQALLTVETTGGGYITIGSLIQMAYPNLYKHRYADREPSVVATQYGWDTNESRKQWMVGFLLKLIVDHILILHDQQTFFELRNYVTLPNGGFGPNSSSGYDDCVTALAQACVCSSTEVLLAYEGPVRTREEAPSSWQAWNEEPA